MRRAQPIRPTQFITTYGPGAILEGAGGPRIIMAIQDSGLFRDRSPREFEIQEPALTSLLPDRAKIFRLPSNAELQVKEREPIYETDPFPRWSLCVQHNVLYHLSRSCPQCSGRQRTQEDAHREAIRFVLACPAGHLDEVPWSFLIKHTLPDCRPEHFLWEGSGGSLRNVQIRCPVCQGAGNLGDAYHREWRCRGARPELRQKDSACSKEARVTQRGASNLFIPEVISAVTIPTMDTALHRALADSAVLSVLQLLNQGGGLQDEATLRKSLQIVEGNLPPAVVQTLRSYSDRALLECAREVLQMTYPQTEEQARLLEFAELQKAATQGHPPAPSPVPGRPPDFEVVKHDVDSAVLGPFKLRVAPVSRLRVVMVQRGYRRLTGEELVSSECIHLTNKWFPGVELFGEGLFLDLLPGSPALTGGADWNLWMDRHRSSGRREDHPAFVWWHTLAHRLIRALSVDSGYSSSSVRERVYLRLDGEKAEGGVLLYAVQPGGDGTLGGLIALVPIFGRVLSRALADLGSCSNDPLCEETTIHPHRVNGAACYACSLVSETSCESRNQSLDRLILRESGV